MNIHTQVDGKYTLVISNGKLNIGSADAYKQKLEQILREGNKLVILDFEKVEYISSVGLRVILEMGKKFKAAGGKFLLVAPEEQIYQVFEGAGFSLLFGLYRTLAEAKAAIVA